MGGFYAKYKNVANNRLPTFAALCCAFSDWRQASWSDELISSYLRAKNANIRGGRRAERLMRIQRVIEGKDANGVVKNKNEAWSSVWSSLSFLPRSFLERVQILIITLRQRGSTR